MITIDKILKEYFLKRDDGGIGFDTRNYDDLYHFETFLLESGYIDQVDRKRLNELFGSTATSLVRSLWNKVEDIVKAGYRRITSIFKQHSDGVSTTIENHDLQDEFYVVIPSIQEPNIGEFQNVSQEIDRAESGENKPSMTEGAEEATKGYYNEALTCEFIVKKNKTPIKVRILSESVLQENLDTDDEMIVVQLDDERSDEIQKIHARVMKNERDLKEKTGNKFTDLKKVITMASQDMADHLINSVGTSGGVIIEILLVGSTETQKGVQHKADIKLKIRKGANQSLKAYSLKMYSGKEINLANLGFNSVIEKFAGSEEIEKFRRSTSQDKEYQLSRNLYRGVALAKSHYQKSKDKKQLFNELNALNTGGNAEYRRKINVFIEKISNEPNFDATVNLLRVLRVESGAEANQLGAKHFASVLTNYIKDADNKENFARNLLKVIGFSDKDTDILLSIVGPRQVKAGKSEIISKHPELDVTDLIIKYTGTSQLSVVNAKTQKPIVKFGLKEGGTTFTSMVSFSNI